MNLMLEAIRNESIPGFASSFLVLLLVLARAIGEQDSTEVSGAPSSAGTGYSLSSPDVTDEISRNTTDIPGRNINDTDGDLSNYGDVIHHREITDYDDITITVSYGDLVTYNVTFNTTEGPNPYEGTFHVIVGICLSLIGILLIFTVVSLSYTYYRHWKRRKNIKPAFHPSELPPVGFMRRIIDPDVKDDRREIVILSTR